MFLVSRFILLLLLVLLLLSSATDKYSVNSAVHVFLIDPTNFDSASLVINKTWQEDYSSESDGGLLVFDGAIAENTTLLIQNIKAKRIEVNASLSRGCTLIIENCDIGPPAFSALDPFGGGIIVAPTIFESSDGVLACTTTTRMSPPSMRHNITIIIRNNRVTGWSKSDQITGIGQFVAADDGAAIKIYNPIICHQNKANDQVSAFIIVSGNFINVSSTSNTRPRLLNATLAVYRMHRVEAETIRRFFQGVSVSPAIDYEFVVPLAFLQVVNNTMNISSTHRTYHVVVGFPKLDWVVDNYFFLNEINNNRDDGGLPNQHHAVVFELAFNRLFLSSSDAIVGDSASSLSFERFGPVSRAPRLPSSTSSSFLISVHDNPEMIYFCRSTKAVFADRIRMMPQFKLTIEMFNNPKIYVVEPDQITSSETLAVSVDSSVRNDTEIIMGNCSFFWNVSSDGRKFAIEVNGYIGLILVDSVSMHMMNQNRTRTGRPPVVGLNGGFIFVWNQFKYVGNITIRGTNFTDTINKWDTAHFVWFSKEDETSNSAADAEVASWGHYGVRHVRLVNNRILLRAMNQSRIIFFEKSNQIDSLIVESNHADTVSNQFQLVYRAPIPESMPDANDFCRVGVAIIRRNTMTSLYLPPDGNSAFSNGLFCFQNLKLDLSIPIPIDYDGNNYLELRADGYDVKVRLLIEDNVLFMRGFYLAVLSDGSGWMVQESSSSSTISPGEQDAQKVMVIRNNHVDIVSLTGANLLLQQIDSTALPPQLFGMRKIIIDGNVVSLKSQLSGALVSTTFRTVLGNGHIFTFTSVYPTNVDFIIVNNIVNASSSMVNGQLQIFCLTITNLVFNNNSFYGSAYEMPIIVRNLPFAESVLLSVPPTVNFTSLSKTKIKTVYLSLNSTTGTKFIDYSFNNNNNQIEPNCSFYNNEPLTPRTFVRLVSSHEATNPIAVYMFGTTAPTSVGPIYSDDDVCPPIPPTHTTTMIENDNTNNNSPPNKNKTKTVSPSSDESQTLSQPQIRNVPSISDSVIRATSVSTLMSSLLSVAPSLAVSAIRTQSVLLGVDEILQNNCENIFSPEMLEKPPEISSSPFQIYFRGQKQGGYASGLIIGGFAFLVSICACWFLGVIFLRWIVTKYGKKLKENIHNRRITSSSSAFSLEFIAKESNIMIPAVNFGLMLLDPMFNTAIALIAIRDVGVGWKVVGVLISMIFLLVFFFGYFVIYKLLFARKKIEYFKATNKNKTSAEQKKKASKHPNFLVPFIDIWKLFMDVEGLWNCAKIGQKTNSTGDRNKNARKSSKSGQKNNNNNNTNNELVTKNDFLMWKLAEPVIEGYTDRFPRFVIVDVIVVFSLALANVVGDISGNCMVMGSMLVVPVALHLFLVIYFRPDQQLLLRICVPVVDVLQLILLGAALALSGTDEASSIVALEVVTSMLITLQMFLTIVTVLGVGAIVVDEYGPLFFKNCRRRRRGGGDYNYNDDDDEEEDNDTTEIMLRRFGRRKNDNDNNSSNNDAISSNLKVFMADVMMSRRGGNDSKSRNSNVVPSASSSSSAALMDSMLLRSPRNNSSPMMQHQERTRNSSSDRQREGDTRRQRQGEFKNDDSNVNRRGQNSRRPSSSSMSSNDRVRSNNDDGNRNKSNPNRSKRPSSINLATL